MRMRMVAAIPAGALLVLLFDGGQAAAEPPDVEGEPDITIDFDGEEDDVPSFEVPLRVGPDTEGEADELSFRLYANDVPLGEPCAFDYADGLPELPANESDVVDATFELREPDGCDLAATGVDELTARSSDISDGDLTIELKRPASLSVGSLRDTLAVAVLVALGLLYLSMAVGSFLDSDQNEPLREASWKQKGLRLVGAAFWLVRVRDGGWWPWRRTEHPKLTWTFSESWLTNFTAIGAIATTLLAATDVLDAMGVPAGDRSGFLLVNIGALALAATAPVAYAGLRTHVERVTTDVRKPVLVIARTRQGGTGRHVDVWTSTMVYRANADGTYDLNVEAPRAYPPDPRAALGSWSGDDATTLAVQVPVEWQEADGSPALQPTDGEKDLTSIGLPIPAASTHPAEVHMRFDASVPVLRAVDKDKDRGEPSRTAIVPVAEETTQRSESGTYLGFFAAALVAAVGLAMQLGATWQIIEDSTITPGTASVIRMFILGVALVAALYVLRTLANRPLVVESQRAEQMAASQTAERVPIEDRLEDQDIQVDSVPAAALRSVGLDVDRATMSDLIQKAEETGTPPDEFTFDVDKIMSDFQVSFDVPDAAPYTATPASQVRWVTPPIVGSFEQGGPRTHIVASYPEGPTSRGDDSAF